MMTNEIIHTDSIPITKGDQFHTRYGKVTVTGVVVGKTKGTETIDRLGIKVSLKPKGEKARLYTALRRCKDLGRGKLQMVDSLKSEAVATGISSEICHKDEAEENRKVSLGLGGDMWYVFAPDRQTAIDRVAAFSGEFKKDLTGEALKYRRTVTGGTSIVRFRVRRVEA